MAWYHRILNGLRGDRLSRDMDREMAFHLAERTDELVGGGMTRDEAAREAAHRFGNRTLVKERTRDADLFTWVASALGDMRYAWRSLIKSPGFSFVAVLSLAIGIGANTAIFSLANALLLKSLPVSRPAELVHVHFDSAADASFSNPLWEELRDRSADFAMPLGHGVTPVNLAPGGIERLENAELISGDFFRVLGVGAVAGRLISRDDDHRGCAGVAVVSQGFAERELGGAAAAPGKVLSLSGHPFEVIGVSDPRFFGLEVGRASNIFVPICALPAFFGPNALDARSTWFIDVLLRPKPGLSLAQVNARLAAIAPAAFAATVPPNFSTADQASYRTTTFIAERARTGLSDLRAKYRIALFTLLAVAAVVLIIACANIANLLLARGAARQREMAIRLALGAGRARLIRQLLTESLMLALTGAAVGILFARWASRLLVGYLTLGGSRVFLDLALDVRVLGFTIAVAAGTALLFGLAPAWRATRLDQAAMRAGGRGMTADSRHRLGRSLVIGQIALSLALVAASGLLLGSFRRLVTLDPGFRREGVGLTRMTFTDGANAPAALLAVQRDVLARLRAMAGVTSASSSVLTPIGGMSWNESIGVGGYSPSRLIDSIAYFNQVSDGYFATLGTPLIAGRDFTGADIEQHHAVAIVNETMAHHFFGAASPLGKTFRISRGDKMLAPAEIIGVVADAKYQRLDESTRATAYLPQGQGDVPSDQLWFEIRADGPPESLTPSVRALAASVNPAISLEVTTFEAQVASSLARPRLLATLSAFFGALALLLAVIGLYGTMSYNVARRRNEIGIRMALGAARGRVLRMVAGEAAGLILLGIAFGTLLAMASTRFVRTLLYGVTATDPPTFGYSALVLGIVALGAALVPALRAARQDPMDALREE